MSRARKYMCFALPVTHVNGRLCNNSVNCPNTIDGGVAESGGFMYGYRRGKKAVSRIGYRIMCRSLTSNPYSQAEVGARNIFAQSSQVAKTALANERQQALILADFAKQHDCATLRGYAVGRIIRNNGVLPTEWE